MNGQAREIVVDNFAGGGGASTGIEMAMGRSVDIAINHDPAAIAMHRANHPTTEHYTEDVWKVNPVEACAGRPVALAWFSPDCKHHSKAKGGKPVDKHIRGLAWVAVKWAKAVHPRVIMLENVEEFRDWGRLDKSGRPEPRYKGETFRRFVCQLEHQGYRVEHRMLRACDYGAPTIRKRFFLIARCDGLEIRWPEPTHADPGGLEVQAGLKKPWVPVADVLDFAMPCPSIFATTEEIWERFGIRAVRPLADATLARIAEGVQRFGRHPFLIQYHAGSRFRGQGVDKPLQTIDASNRYGLCMAFLTRFNRGGNGDRLDRPLRCITAQGQHYGLIKAFLTSYYGNGCNSDVSKPMPTATGHDRFGLVQVMGDTYGITDIGLRMLTPRELFDAQGFPHDYIIDVDADGNPYPKSEQVARCGNAVCPQIPMELVRANLPEICKREKTRDRHGNHRADPGSGAEAGAV